MGAKIQSKKLDNFANLKEKAPNRKTIWQQKSKRKNKYEYTGSKEREMQFPDRHQGYAECYLAGQHNLGGRTEDRIFQERTGIIKTDGFGSKQRQKHRRYKWNREETGMKKQRRENIRRAGQIISAAALSAALFLAPAAPVFADDVTNSSSFAEKLDGVDDGDTTTITIHYGKVTKEVPASKEDLENGLWDTYTDETGKVYNLKNHVFGNYYYEEAGEEDALQATINLVTEDGTVLRTDKVGVDQPYTPEATIEVNGTSYIAESLNPITFDYKNSPSLNFNVVYREAKEEAVPYNVTVNYVDKGSGKVLAVRNFTVTDVPHTFIAPSEFSIQSEDKAVYYTAIDKTKTSVTMQPEKEAEAFKDHVVNIEYTVRESGSYNWYIIYCDAENNAKIGTETVPVEYGKTEEKVPDLNKTFKVGGQDKNYTLNAAFKDGDAAKTITHTYGDTNRVTYVYYDPEGYKSDNNIRERQINVEYRYVENPTDILKTEKVTVKTTDTYIRNVNGKEVESNGLEHPIDVSNIEANGTTYAICAGQGDSIVLNYFPLDRTTYIVYFYDINDKNFDQAPVITREIPVTTEIQDRGTTYTFIPGITRIIVTNPTTGTTTEAGVEGTNGTQIASNIPTPAGNINAANGNNGTANDSSNAGNTNSSEQSSSEIAGAEEGTDTTIDGVNIDEIQTPQGNLKLNEKRNNTTRRLIGALIAALAAILVLYIVIANKRRQDPGIAAATKRKKKQDENKQ